MTPIKKWVSGVTFALVILLAPLLSQAFPPDSTSTPPNDPPGNPPGYPPPPPPVYVPIDSGIVFLLTAGLGLGIITMVVRRRDQGLKKEL